MSDLKKHLEYSFTEQDVKTIQSHFERVRNSTQVALEVKLCDTHGFAGLTVSVYNSKLNVFTKLLHIQSWREAGKPVVFSLISDQDGTPFGPVIFYESLLEALIYADVLLRRTLEVAAISTPSGLSTQKYKGFQLAAEQTQPQKSESKKDLNLGVRFGSAVCIIGMFLVFGVVCSLLGFAAFFATKSKLGIPKAIGLTVAVALTARFFIEYYLL